MKTCRTCSAPVRTERSRFCQLCYMERVRKNNKKAQRKFYRKNRKTILARETARIQKKRKKVEYQRREREAVRLRMRQLRANRKCQAAHSEVAEGSRLTHGRASY